MQNTKDSKREEGKQGRRRRRREKRRKERLGRGTRKCKDEESRTQRLIQQKYVRSLHNSLSNPRPSRLPVTQRDER